MDTKTERAKRGIARAWPWVASAAVIGFLLLLYGLNEDFRRFLAEGYEVLTSEDRTRSQEWVHQYDPWGPLIIIGGMWVQMFLFVVPSWLLMIVAAMAYGPLWGAVISYLAVASASTLGYFIGRAAGEAFIDKLIGEKKKKKLFYYVEEYGLWAIIITRLAPFLSNDAISFIGGLLRLGYLKFMLATTVGILPLIILISIVGRDMHRLKLTMWWITGASVLLFLAYFFYRKTSPKHSRERIVQLKSASGTSRTEGATEK